jgi:hypothetical protein
MAKYALVDDNLITQVQVAESEDALGPLALLFEVVQIDGLNPEPARGWERVNGFWCPPGVPEAAKALWNGTGFEGTAELEAPAEDEEEEEEDDK